MQENTIVKKSAIATLSLLVFLSVSAFADVTITLFSKDEPIEGAHVSAEAGAKVFTWVGDGNDVVTLDRQQQTVAAGNYITNSKGQIVANLTRDLQVCFFCTNPEVVQFQIGLYSANDSSAGIWSIKDGADRAFACKSDELKMEPFANINILWDETKNINITCRTELSSKEVIRQMEEGIAASKANGQNIPLIKGQ